MNLIRALLGRKWWWVTVIVVVAMGVMVRLGIWQLDRLEERRAANIELAAALAAPPFALTADLPLNDLPSLQNRLVTASGEYDFDYQGIIKLQNFQGQAGVHLLAPLVLADGETAVLINRGWLPLNETDLSKYEEGGPVMVEGYIALSQTLLRGSSPETNSLEWFRVDIEQIERQMPYALLPLYIVESSETTALPLPIPREIKLSEGSHLSYALQWFAFCVILGVGYVFYVKKRA